MLLGELLGLKPTEARVIVDRSLSESPMAAPRWNFSYSKHKNDPAPDALVLGTYQHPGSGNELLGGINLHYLSRDQVTGLRQALPAIMRGGDLKGRYRIGKRLLPDVFNNFYRTYRSDYVHAIQPSQLPYWYDQKTGRDKAAKTRKQKEVELRSTQQRQAELRRQALQHVGRPPAPGPAQASDRMAQPDSLDAIQQQQRQGQLELQRLADKQRERAQQLAVVKRKADAIDRARQAQRKLERERQRNLQQLITPNPEQDEEGDPLAVPGESITYWSPVYGRYITEQVDI